MTPSLTTTSYISFSSFKRGMRGELLVCVTSHPKNRVLRDVIRKTWGSIGIESHISDNRVLPKLTILFFLGEDPIHNEDVALEQELHDDLVIIPKLQEKFSEIWLKTISVLTFASNYFRRNKAKNLRPEPGIRYLLKADDDAMLNLPEVVDDLFVRMDLRVGVYWGYVMTMVTPVGESNLDYVVKAIGINIVCRRVISISYLQVTPFWHGCPKMKFRNISPKKNLKWFLESLFKFKNLCRSRILVFVLDRDLQKSTPKIKIIPKRIKT